MIDDLLVLIETTLQCEAKKPQHAVLHHYFICPVDNLKYQH